MASSLRRMNEGYVRLSWNSKNSPELGEVFGIAEWRPNLRRSFPWPPKGANSRAKMVDPLRAVTAAGPDEPFCSTADEPKAEPPSAGHRAGRRGSVLPDLRTQTSSENAARPQDADQRSAPRNRHRPQQKKTSVAQPGGLLQEPASSDHVSTPQIKPAVDAMSLSDHPQNGSGPQPAAPAVSSTVRSAKPRRSVRALDQSWAYRAACRKAMRRGEPLPARAVQRRKQR